MEESAVSELFFWWPEYWNFIFLLLAAVLFGFALGYVVGLCQLWTFKNELKKWQQN